MQRFQFSMQRALELRTSQLEVEQARLTRLNSERARLQELASSMVQSRAEAVEQTHSTTAPVSGADLARVAQYRDALSVRITRVQAQIKEFDGRIGAQLRRVVEADRNKQLLEQLKQQQLDEWTYEFNRELENTAGELYLARRCSHTV